jgi:hypothetical protein
MTRCPEFYEKLERDGNFCGLSPSEISRIKAYRELIDKISKQGIDRTLAYEHFPAGAARELTSLKDDEVRIKGLNYVVACLKRNEKITAGDLQSTVKSWSPLKSGSHSKKLPFGKNKDQTVPESAKEPQIEKPPAGRTTTTISTAPLASITTGQVIEPEHGVILSEAYCRAKNCEQLKPCKERGNRLECYPAGAEPRHMSECPIEKRQRKAQEQGFGPASDYDSLTGGKLIKSPPYKIAKAPEVIHFEPSPVQWDYINRARKEMDATPAEFLSALIDTAMLQEGL